MSFEFPMFPDQFGLATTKQLLDAGATASTLRQLAVRGQRVMRTVYAPQPGPLPPQARLMAAMLWAGPPAMLTGVAALAQHGLDIDRQPPIRRLLVPETKRSRRSPHGFEIVRSRRLPKAQLKQGIRVAPVARALVDAGRLRELPNAALTSLTLGVLQEKRTLPEHVTAELDAGLPGGTHGVRDGVYAFRAGAWSVPEGLLADGVRSRDALPAMLANPRLLDSQRRLIGVPDGYFPDAGVVVQVHSKKFHAGEDEDGVDRWAATLARDVAYTCQRLTVVPVAPETLRGSMEAFLDQLTGIVLARLGFDGSHVVIDHPDRIAS